MLPMQNKQKARSSTRSVREVSVCSSKTDSFKGVASRICSKYEKVVEDGPNSKRIIYRIKNPHPSSDIKSMTSSVSRITTDYPESQNMNNEMRLMSGYHNPCVINIMSQFDCKTKTEQSNMLPLNPVVTPTVIQIHLNDSSTNPFLQRHLKCLYMSEKKRPRKMTRGTQTLYRESSMQTLPYLPDVSNDKETLKTLEIYKLSKLLKGDGPPGIWEVEILERARKRWAIEKSLNEEFQCAIKAARTDVARKKKLSEHRAILEAFEWESWLEREENIQGCQMMRFQLVLHIFEKRQREMHKSSDMRIQKRCEEIIQKRNRELKQNDIEFGREMRRLKIKHEKKPRNWRKEKVSDQLGDPSSEYYAPQMRYGVNPNRRHFQLSRKAFEMRMEDLEKRAVNMKNLKCPFAKLKEWSKPKEQKTEVEQNFCSEGNLQKLYEGLKGLREQSKKQKVVPKCLIEKIQKPPVEEDFISECEVVEELETCEDCSSVEMCEEETQAGSSYSKNSLLEMYSQQNQIFTVAEMLEEGHREELENMLAEYEGTAIGWLMRFLSEEQSRLQEQRKLHFVTMLAQKERWRREAAEAGLRQKENEMRKIYEQIFEETDKSNAEVCEQYLDNIFGIDTQEQADFEAISSVTNLAKIIDKDLQRWLKSFKQIQNPLNYDNLRCLLRDLVFPDNIAHCLSQKYETQSIIDYIINDVLLEKVYERLEPIDVAQSIAYEFVDRLIDTDLYLFSSECSSGCDCQEECTCMPPELESKAILRKLIRYSVPGRRWRTQTERIADENVNDIIDDICGAKETLKRCTFNPKAKKKYPPKIQEIPSVINLFTTSYLTECDGYMSSRDTSMENAAAGRVTVIKYVKANTEAESRKASLVGNEKLLWDDTSRSSSQLQLIRDLSRPGLKLERAMKPVPLKLAPSTFDMQRDDLDHKKDSHSTSGIDDELLNFISFGYSKASKKSQDISEDYLEDIINQVIKDIVPSPPNENDSEIEELALSAKSQMTLRNLKIPADMSEDTEVSSTETYMEIKKEAEENDFPQSQTFNEHCEEELVGKVSHYEMVMYEGELKQILDEDDDECKCQMELDYQKTIRQLYESGKIKVIYKQKQEESILESEEDQTDINIGEMTFEYATSVENTIALHTEESFEDVGEYMDYEELGSADKFEDNDDKPTEAEERKIGAVGELATETTAKETETAADVPQDVTDATSVVKEVTVEEVAIEADNKETTAVADTPQDAEIITGVKEPVMEAADVPPETIDNTVVEEEAMVNEAEPVAPEESP